MTDSIIRYWGAIVLWFVLAISIVLTWGWWALVAGITLGAVRATSQRYGK
jgi:hypothetical protein